MKLSVKLTLDGLVRALRTRGHDLADEKLAKRIQQRRRRESPLRRSDPVGRKP